MRFCVQLIGQLQKRVAQCEAAKAAQQRKMDASVEAKAAAEAARDVALAAQVAAQCKLQMVRARPGPARRAPLPRRGARAHT